jgi:hypothetical protein
MIAYGSESGRKGWALESQPSLKEALADAARADPEFPDGRFNGRGVVICAGGARLFTCAWVAIGILRHLGCTLPIEVWYLGRDEMGPPMRGLLEERGAEPVDALQVARLHGVERLGGWELKPYAIMHSRFREVLLLDADNVPARDPSFLFEQPEYLASGALFWPDRVRLSPSNEVWVLSGLNYREMASFESGQMVLDKFRCWRALSLTHWLNQRSDTVYRFLHGDKDTFLIAWLMVGQDFHLIPFQPKTLDGVLCQRGPDGAVLFQHRTQVKWILEGENPAIPGFRLEKECLALLDELATLWDGRIFNPPPRSEAAQRIETDLADTRDFILHRVSSDRRMVALLPDHRIRSGLGSERYWYVTDTDRGPELRIEGGGLPNCALRPSKGGNWHGRLLQAPGMPVELSPVDPRQMCAQESDSRNIEARAWLERVLALGVTMPADGDVVQDIVTTLRVLSAADPEFAVCLRTAIQRWPALSSRGRIVRAAVQVIDDMGQDARADVVERGHSWLNQPFSLGKGYQRI